MGYLLTYIDLSTGDASIISFPLHIELVYNEIQKLSIKEIVVNKNLDKNIQVTLSKLYGILVSICDDYNVDNYLNSLFVNIKKNI